MGDYERNQKKLQELWDNLMSDEDTSLYGDIYESDEYQPSDSSSSCSSNSLPSKCSPGIRCTKKRLKRGNDSRQSDGSSSASTNNLPANKHSKKEPKAGPSKTLNTTKTLPPSDKAKIEAIEQEREVDTVSEEDEVSLDNVCSYLLLFLSISFFILL